ncbi:MULTISPECIES: hypothetical protein [unclassified Pseudoalteromonas]|uniref:hypothetical protein n=1 Tax=unclassified Pseudoalteromonas TaxID=194690 RepID=UPI00158D8F25|nr:MULTISPECIES: hypothetical protein [unclassified Pseudoalteromonas]MDN3488107.1 hypothetical protein [Pseudoalteromonas sp. APC 3694]
MNTLSKFSLVTLFTALTGCSTASKDISARYVSPIQYSSYDCTQLQEESYRITRIVSELGGRIDEKASRDKLLVATPYTVWFVGGNQDQEAEYSRLKGEYDAVQQSLIQKKCSQSDMPNYEQTSVPSSEAVIIVGKPQGSIYISPTIYKDYSCEDLNEEFIGVSRASNIASLQSIDDSISYLSTRYNDTALDRQTRELKAHELNNTQASNEANYDARLYALVKAASKINNCQMSMNNKKIILSK